MSSDEEALRLADDTPYNVVGAVFSADRDRAERLAIQLHVGMANVNTLAGDGAGIRSAAPNEAVSAENRVRSPASTG